MQEVLSLLEDKDSKETWTVLKVRTVFLSLILASALFLILRSLLFSPEAPERPYILNGTAEQEILKSLKWYAENSSGSLELDDNRCILETTQGIVLCKSSLLAKKSAKDLLTPLSLKEDKKNWPYIWLTKTYDKEVALEFAMYALEPIKVLSQKERTTVLGTELIVEVEFKRNALTSVSKKILALSEIKNLEGDIGTNFIGTVTFLPNPLGYYLPTYPLP